MASTNLTDLQTFTVVARLRSFRAAALELGVSPSAISHSMRTLEERLGLRLLNRTTRSVAATVAGEHLLARLAPALLEIQGALDEVNALRDSPLGTLRINAPHAAAELVLAPLITRFLTAHPGMKVDLVTDDSFVDIVANGFDAGVRFGESLQQDMVAIPLGGPQRFIVVASPAYLAAHGRPQAPSDLPQHRCIGIRFHSGVVYRWEFARGGEQLEVEVDGALFVSDNGLMIRAAEDGLGLAYVYAQYAQAGLAAGRLCQVLEDWCPEIPGFFLYYPSRKQMPAGLKAFVELVKAGMPSAVAGG